MDPNVILSSSAVENSAALHNHSERIFLRTKFTEEQWEKIIE